MASETTGDQAHILDCTMRALSEAREGALWSISGDQLNINVIRFDTGHGVQDHVNDEVDVLGVVLHGRATLRLDGGEHELRAGLLFYVPRGWRRALHVTEGPLVYVSCHQRRAGLWPTARPALPG